MPDIFISPSDRGPDPKEQGLMGDNKKNEPARNASQSEAGGEPKTVGKKAVKVKSSSKHQKHSMFPLAAFADHPEGVFFANQGENEIIHLFLRKHFITNIPWIVASILLFLLPFFLFPYLGSLIPAVAPANLPLILGAFYYIAVFGAIVMASFINWYFNVYIVTNERVIDVDFVNILYREVSATRLNLIQDVTVRTGGVIRAIFNYGDVFIQTAGTETNFDFIATPHPQEVAREIEMLMEQARRVEGISEIEEALER